MSVLIWPFSCSIVVFVLTTHKKKRIALSPYLLSRSPHPTATAPPSSCRLRTSSYRDTSLSVNFSAVGCSCRDTWRYSCGLLWKWVLQGYSAGLVENAPVIPLRAWASRRLSKDTRRDRNSVGFSAAFSGNRAGHQARRRQCEALG